MQTASYYASPVIPQPLSATESLKISVTHLLSRCLTMPCSAAGDAFMRLVQPQFRFQAALDVLHPFLTSQAETPRRIVAAYILYLMYATHPIAMNPFRLAFVEAFSSERDKATKAADRGGVSENEQLVWVIWKILRAEGNDLGPYSALTLASSPLPPKLRAAHLTIDDSITVTEDVTDRNRELLDSSSPNGINVPDDSPGAPSLSLDTQRTVYDDLIVSRLLREGVQRVLKLSEMRTITEALPTYRPHTTLSPTDIPNLISHNPDIGSLVISRILQTPSDGPNGPNAPNGQNLKNRFTYLEPLRQLPPSNATFNALARLLRDDTIVLNPFNNPGLTTIADVVRTEVLGTFIHNAIEVIEKEENADPEGFFNADTVQRAVQGLCRFYRGLVNIKIIDTTSDADTAEMTHFALSHARYEEGNALYRVLMMGKY